MSLIDAPLALIDRLVARRTPSVQPDDPIARLVARTSARLRPNPAYQRRLRSRVMNQFVAMREGLVPVPGGRREMGRLGRSVLYASLGLAVGATAVGAASTQSLPGDVLYAVKLRLEQVRMEIAPPSVKPALAAAALDERLSEVEKLAAAGRWALVPLAAEEATDAEATLVAMGGTPGDAAMGLARHRKVLAMLMAAAPPSARSGIALALAASNPPLAGGQGNGAGAINGNAGGDGNNLSQGHQGKGTPGSTGDQAVGSPAVVATPTPTVLPTPVPSATHSGEPHETRSPRPSAASDASGEPGQS